MHDKTKPNNPFDDGIPPYVAKRIFQLEPEPPVEDSLNKYILAALQEKDLKYFSFFLHHHSLTSVSKPSSVWMVAIYTTQTDFWIESSPVGSKYSKS